MPENAIHIPGAQKRQRFRARGSYHSVTSPFVRFAIQWNVFEVKTRQQRTRMEILLRARLNVVVTRTTIKCWGWGQCVRASWEEQKGHASYL